MKFTAAPGYYYETFTDGTTAFYRYIVVAVDTVDGKLAVNIFVFAVIHHFLYLIILVVAYRYLIAGRCLEAVLGKACGKVANVGIVDTDIAYHLRGAVKSDNGLELQAFGDTIYL